MIDDGKIVTVLFISCLLSMVSGEYKCHDGDTSSQSADNYTAQSGREVCCKVEHSEESITVTHFGCQTGCCGERDDQYCCKARASNNNRHPSVIGGSIAGGAIFVIAVVLLSCVYRRYCREDYKCSDHKKLLKEVYAAESLTALFVPAHALVSGPGTIIHPTTHISGPLCTMDAPAYVMPDLDQPQILVQPPPPPPDEHVANGDDDEANWDTWDGFPASGDHVGTAALSGTDSAGRGRDNPYYHGEGEEGGEGEGGLPYYYEHYDRYAQPPPGYEEVTQ